jgi:hypothetical protein
VVSSATVKNLNRIGDCRNESVIEEVFGSVSEFARLVEEHGNEFLYGSVQITYDERNDVHTFWI